ncbi:MAG TPA: hypothetical protein VMM16_14640 [Verrucomicrobiae bacterium]|nr:hypothetical protein [Verrucomicrobiae bacterium]
MKLIRATDLDTWAKTHGSRAALSEMVSALIRASISEPSYIRFPTGDSAEIPDYDGSLVAPGAPPYVPDGQSVWEVGTDSRYLRKANEEFKRRSEAPGAFDPSETTFVFVTPRTWKSKSKKKPKRKLRKGGKTARVKKKGKNGKQVTLTEWEKEKTKTGPWRSVRVIDGVALEAWLDDCPAVASRIAREMLPLLPQTGTRSTDEFWKEFASRFRPELTEQVLLCGREKESAQLLPQLAGQAGSYPVRGDSAEEVIAFAVASIRKAEDSIRKYLESRTLIVESRDAAQSLAGRKNLCFLIYPSVVESAGLLSRGNPVLVPLGREDSRRDGSVVLKRPTAYEMGEALRTMGLSQDGAIQLARKAARSVTVLARRIPNPSAPVPDWAEDANLVPAMLLGGWNADAAEDQKIVCEVAGVSKYEQYEAQIRKYLKMGDSPLEREGAVWHVLAPVDAFAHLAYLVGAEHFDRLRAVFQQAFAERDPSLELAPEERPYSLVTGKKLKHSGWLRDGLATTLLLFASDEEGSDLRIPGGAQNYVNGLVRSLPGLNQDWRVIASLAHQLPLLMEAAPRPLLEALEQMLGGSGETIRPVFRDTDAIFSSSPHTGLLWALEVAAWDPEYLPRASLVLAGLARVDPGGKLTNRPIDSLRQIFLPWLPNTNARPAQRLAALDSIIANEPAIGWQLTLKLLPEYHSIGHRTAMPRFREAGDSDREAVTNRTVWETYSQIADRALKLAGDDPQRWTAIIPLLPTFSRNDRQRAHDLLERFGARAEAEQRTVVWTALQELVNRHRTFHDAPWSMKGGELEKLEALVKQLEPEDLSDKLVWLFNDHHPDLPDADPADSLEALEKARQAAARQVYENGGASAVIAMADSVKLPRFLGFAVVGAVGEVQTLADLVDLAVGKSEGLDEFAMALSAESARRHREAWKAVITQRVKEKGRTPEQAGRLLLWWNDDPDTWTFVASLGAEIERYYWMNKPVWGIRDGDAALGTAARKYLDVGRAIAAISILHPAANRLSLETIFRALDSAVPEINASKGQVSNMVIYELETIFRALAQRTDVDMVQLAQREYAYLPLLAHSDLQLVLHDIMARDPALFVSVICDVFKPAASETAKPDEQQRRRARAGYQLLSGLDTVPGVKGAEIDAATLKNWIDGVQKGAAEKDRVKIAEEYIGHVLAHAPFGANGAWPHPAICQILEDVKSDWIERGMEIERFNMRGAFTKAMYEGGGQERGLAAQAADWAKAAAQWPRAQSMLLRLSETWTESARQADERARQDEMKFEG